MPATASEIFVSNERDNTVTVLDSSTLKVIKTIAVGTRPRGIVITPDFGQVLVCNGDKRRHFGDRHKDARGGAQARFGSRSGDAGALSGRVGRLRFPTRTIRW